MHLFGCVCQLGTQDFFCVETWLRHQNAIYLAYNWYKVLLQTWYTCSSIKLAEQADFFFRFLLY